MGQSLSQMYVHLIFGTKNRYPFISDDIRPTLHAYIAGILKNKESPALKINSIADHIHILFRLSKNHSLAKVVEEVKKYSSKWMKTEGIQGFTWQIGYGAFSVSSSNIEIVKEYIQHQRKNHTVRTFKEEVEELVKQSNVLEYDDQYFWR